MITADSRDLLRPHQPSGPSNLQYSTEVVLWIISFCFATCAALLFQKFLLPLIPSLHAGNGLLDGDASYFHSVASALADKIRLDGWQHWRVYPDGGATGNVAILAALYVIFGNDPSLIVPINAAIHASSAVLIFRIGRMISPDRAGRLGALAAAIMFVAFPSALNWYGQIHKDGFAIAGNLLALYSWLSLCNRPLSTRSMTMMLGSALFSVLLIAFVRPYHLLPLFMVMALLFVVTVCAGIFTRTLHWKRVAAFAAMLLIFAGGAAWTKSSWNTAGVAGADSYSNANVKMWHWKRSHWLPGELDYYVELSARTRAGLIQFGRSVQAGSVMDADIAPDNVPDVIAYAPRAIQIALFAPFPPQWLEKLSPTRLVSIAETLIWYAIAPGIVMAVVYARNTALLLTIAFALPFLYVFGFTIANLGTLYRIRYPYLFLLILAGAIGWAKFYLARKHDRLTAPAVPAPLAADTGIAASARSRATVFAAGLLVATLTVCTYGALFLRDIILAKSLGIGSALDALFLANAIPMFIVSAFSIPLGTMLIPPFLGEIAQKSPPAAQQLVSGISTAYTTAVIPLCVILHFAAPNLLSVSGANVDNDTFRLAVSLFRWTLPILALSGYVIISNAILNALGKFAIAASAQIVVPLISILAFLTGGQTFGITSLVVGMLAGQILNLAVVAIAVQRCGHTPFPLRFVPIPSAKAHLGQYLPLVAAAVFVNGAGPINVYMASSLDAGNVAMLGLGGKLVLFVTGIISAAVATVVLPHFSSYMARNRLIEARGELSFFLLAAAVITIPLTLLFYAGAETIVGLAFVGGVFHSGDAQSVARVMANGILQLPFYTINLLILKFAVATRHAGRIMVVSMIGLMINVALNYALMPTMGAAGIALATAIATAVSSGLMLLFFFRLGHIASLDIVLIGLNGLLFTTLIICWHYHSPAGVGVALIGLTALQYGQWKWLKIRQSPT